MDKVNTMTDNENNGFDVWGFNNEMQKITANHVKLLMEQYKTVKGIYGFPNKAFMETITQNWPDWVQEFYREFDKWLESQMKLFEDNIGESVRDYVKAISDLKFTTPNMNRYQMLVDEHIKLWIENCKKIRERREQINQESLESMKKTLPAPVHPMLETAYKWVMEQNENTEKEIIERVKKFSLGMRPDEE